MCGIFGGVSLTADQLRLGVAALHHRGPDFQRVMEFGPLALGHTRLSILDLDPRSHQPFSYGRTHVAYNGELWNFREVRADLEALGLTFTTPGDTEVIAAALDTWGARALPRFNGMFAVAWVDGTGQVYLARDRFGEIPLHFAPTRTGGVAFASELKALTAAGIPASNAHDVQPGSTVTLAPGKRPGLDVWSSPDLTPLAITREEAAGRLRQLVLNGATERAISDVPVCALLSGGIDSAAVALALRDVLPDLTTYTAVMNPRSNDLKGARITAHDLGLRLIEVQIPEPTAADLARVIRHIEMPHKAQIEIGWACLVLAERMALDGFKVTFSGEGSDELWASYGFSYHALQTEDWHVYRRDLFLTQARKNFARCNKIFMAHSVECRLPFLHPPLVDFALRLPRTAVQDGKARPKAVLQDAFTGYLPDTITKRAKVAFQDGLGLKEKAGAAVADPLRYYRAEFASQYGRKA